MYLHLGNDAVLRKSDIVAIFDMDNTTVSKQSRGFLTAAQRSGAVIDITDDLPKSYIVAVEKGKMSIYISSVSSKTLQKRWKSSKIISGGGESSDFAQSLKIFKNKITEQEKNND